MIRTIVMGMGLLPGLAWGLLGHETKDYRMAVLITAADSQRVYKGALIAPKDAVSYFPEALFSHLTILHPQGNGQEDEGTFIPDIADRYRNNVDSIVRLGNPQVGSNSLWYHLSGDELLDRFRTMGLRIPGAFRSIIPGGRGWLDADTLNVETNKKRQLFYALLPQAFTEEELARKPLPDNRAARFDQSVLIEFGSRKDLSEEMALLSKGDAAAGKILYAKHFNSIPLIVDIYAIESEDQVDGQGNKVAQFKFPSITGRYLTWHNLAKQGAVVRPSLSAPVVSFGFPVDKLAAVSLPPEPEVPVQSILGNSNKFDVEIDAAKFLDRIVAPVVFAVPKIKGTTLECILPKNANPSFKSNCENRTVNNAPVQIIKGTMTPAGVAGSVPLKLWVRPKNNRSIGYRVEIGTDAKPVAELPASNANAHLATWKPGPSGE